jgi:hypothetical protein
VESEGSLPCSQELASPRSCVTYCNKLDFYGEGLLSLSPNPQAGGPPFISCPQLFIHYIRSYSPYLEAVPFIRNPTAQISKIYQLEVFHCSVLLRGGTEENAVNAREPWLIIFTASCNIVTLRWKLSGEFHFDSYDVNCRLDINKVWNCSSFSMVSVIEIQHSFRSICKLISFTAMDLHLQ